MAATEEWPKDTALGLWESTWQTSPYHTGQQDAGNSQEGAEWRGQGAERDAMQQTEMQGCRGSGQPILGIVPKLLAMKRPPPLCMCAQHKVTVTFAVPFSQPYSLPHIDNNV